MQVHPKNGGIRFIIRKDNKLYNSPMKTLICVLMIACFFSSSCQRVKSRIALDDQREKLNDVVQNEAPNPMELILLPHPGESKIDHEISRYQGKIRLSQNTFQSIEHLGWLYVAKARESFDPGYYKLAEQCANCLDSEQPQCSEGLLLRGQVLENLHRFKGAETLARELVAKRGLSFDYGLLGDSLMEQGRLDEAADAYQKMVNIKPDLEAYARIAHYRWLKGDIAAATTLMQMAVSASSPNAPESAAWVTTRLAFYQFQNGKPDKADQSCALALEYQKNYAPALLLRGRILLSEGKANEAVEVLTESERLNPLPDYEWVLLEALHSAGREQEAVSVQARLDKCGPSTDPRTYSLYLSTSGRSNKTSIELARNELSNRADVFTHDALAWALASNGNAEDAYKEMQKALVEGTYDGRLFFHATVIASESGHEVEAAAWLRKALVNPALLLPSEQKQLSQVQTLIGEAAKQKAVTESKTAALFMMEK